MFIYTLRCFETLWLHYSNLILAVFFLCSSHCEHLVIIPADHSSNSQHSAINKMCFVCSLLIVLIISIQLEMEQTEGAQIVRY